MKVQHCVVLPVALLLLAGGLVTLFLFGLGNLEPYAHTKDFRAANCTVLSSNITGDKSCVVKDPLLKKPTPARPEPDTILLPAENSLNINDTVSNGTSWQDNERTRARLDSTLPDTEYTRHSNETFVAGGENVTMGSTTPRPTTERPILSAYQCVHVLVNFSDSASGGVSRSQVVLYDTYQSLEYAQEEQLSYSCSVHVCDADEADNQQVVRTFLRNNGEVGDMFKCYYDPSHSTEAYAYIVTGTSVLHTLVWPSLAVGFGVFLLIVFIFQSCEVWICRNPRPCCECDDRRREQEYQLAPLRRDIIREPRTENRDHTRPRDSDDDEGYETGVRPKKGHRPFSSAADIVRKFSFSDRKKGRRSYTESQGVPPKQSTSRWGEPRFSTT